MLVWEGHAGMCRVLDGAPAQKDGCGLWLEGCLRSSLETGGLRDTMSWTLHFVLL